MSAFGHPLQSFQGFPTVAGFQNQHLTITVIIDVLHIHKQIWSRQDQFPQFHGDIDCFNQSRSCQKDFTIRLESDIKNLLDAQNVACNTGDDDTAFSVDESIQHFFFNLAVTDVFRSRFGITGIAQQRQYSAFSDIRNFAVIGLIHRGCTLIKLEITCIDDTAFFRLHTDPYRIRDGMRGSEEPDTGVFEFNFGVLIDNVIILKSRSQSGGIDRQFSQRNRQSCTEHGCIDILQQIRQCSYGIRMTMRQENTRYLIFVFLQVSKIRDDDVNSQ